MSRRLSVGLLAAAAIAGGHAGIGTAGPGSPTTHISEPFAFTIDNPCTGEAVELAGQLDGVVTSGITPTGQIHLAEVFTIRVSGVSASGIEYRYVQTSPDHQALDLDGAPANGTAETVGNLISQGGTDNFVQRTLFHLTVDANGEVTATVDQVTIECTG